MNWYKKAQFGGYEKTIDGLSYMDIVRRIENAKARISRNEAQEAVFIRYLKTVPSDSVKNMWMNRILSLQKSRKISEKTLNKYLQMMEGI